MFSRFLIQDFYPPDKLHDEILHNPEVESAIIGDVKKIIYKGEQILSEMRNNNNDIDIYRDNYNIEYSDFLHRSSRISYYLYRIITNTGKLGGLDYFNQEHSSRLYTHRLKFYLNILSEFIDIYPKLHGYRLIKAYSLLIEEDISEIIPLELRDFINALYEDKGYVYHYFGYILKDHPFTQVLLGKIKLNPDIFEALASTSLHMYRNVTRTIEQNIEPHHILPRTKLIPRAPKGYGRFGWSKRTLGEAIIKQIHASGLPVIEKTWDIRGPVVKTVHRIYIPARYFRFRNNDKLRTEIGTDDIVLAGFPLDSDSFTYNKPYYETLYRKLFSTTKRINYGLICQDKLVSLGDLQFVATSDFGLPPGQIRNLSYDEICQLLQDQTIRRRELLFSLAEEAMEIRDPLIYQPGSPYVRPQMLEYFAPSTREEQIPPDYQTIMDICKNVNEVSRGELIFYASEYDIPIPRGASKEQICSILKNYIRVFLESRRPI